MVTSVVIIADLLADSFGLAKATNLCKPNVLPAAGLITSSKEINPHKEKTRICSCGWLKMHKLFLNNKDKIIIVQCSDHHQPLRKSHSTVFSFCVWCNRKIIEIGNPPIGVNGEVLRHVYCPLPKKQDGLNALCVQPCFMFVQQFSLQCSYLCFIYRSARFEHQGSVKCTDLIKFQNVQ